MKYTVTEIDGTATVLTVLHDGELLTAIAGHHPNFQAILDGLHNGLDSEDILDLFDVQRAVNRHFDVLSDRVYAKDGVVYFDGDPVHNSLTEQVIRFLNEGVDDWFPLVNFFENVQQNPNANSREQLFEWLSNDESLTITEDGYIVAYKGCNTATDGTIVSTRPAPEHEQVTVDGELVTGYVPQREFSTVAMPRSVVDPDEDIHCSVGLHVGTDRYARSFAPVVVEVHVNPRDVVSVTSDSNREKIRTCKYEVIGPIEQRYTQAVISTPAYRDTRDNHKTQERIPAGQPGAGRFKPKA